MWVGHRSYDDTPGCAGGRCVSDIPRAGNVGVPPLGAGDERGADDEARTRDIDLGKVALYQLSYIRSARRTGRRNSTQTARDRVTPVAPPRARTTCRWGRSPERSPVRRGSLHPVTRTAGTR